MGCPVCCALLIAVAKPTSVNRSAPPTLARAIGRRPLARARTSTFSPPIEVAGMANTQVGSPPASSFTCSLMHVNASAVRHTPRGCPVDPDVLTTTAMSSLIGASRRAAVRINSTIGAGVSAEGSGTRAIVHRPRKASSIGCQRASTHATPAGTSSTVSARSCSRIDIEPSVGAAGSVAVMDTRTRYPLPPVAPEGSPAWQDPAHSSMRPGCSWQQVGEYRDIRYELSTGDDAGIAKITINRPEKRNAFRPQTLFELTDAMNRARDDDGVGVIILTGQGDLAFCSGGDQVIRGDDGYIGDDEIARKGIGRLNVLDLQIQIRRTPKPVIAMIAGYAIGGGHVLHVVCDLSIAADNARFGQTGPKVGSFDGGYGSGLLARTIGQKRSREVWYTCRQYGAEQAFDWGLVNAVVPIEDLEVETVRWAKDMLQLSPLALRMLKASHNAADDGLAGVQQLAGDATLLFYMTEEAQEGRDAYKEKRQPDFGRFPRRP